MLKFEEFKGSLVEKEKASLSLIEETLKKHKNPVLSCSFGKDSTVTLDLVRRVKADIKVLWTDTGVEYPDTRMFADRLIDQWKLDMIILSPDGWNFWKIVEKYGWPLGARRRERATGKCCWYLKKKPLLKATKEYGFDLLIDGLTAYEGRDRYFTFRRNGEYRYSKELKNHKLSPLAWWTPDDVWGYIEKNGLPYNTYYDKELDRDMTKRGIKRDRYTYALRVGCWPCTVTLTSGGMRHLREFYPGLWKVLMKRGLAKFIMDKKLKTQTDFFENEVEQILKSRPCFFDKL